VGSMDPIRFYRWLLVAVALLAALVAGVYWMNTDSRGKRKEPNSSSSNPGAGSLQNQPSGNALGFPVPPPQPSLSDFVAKYRDRTPSQLEFELGALNKLIERKYVALLNARRTDGKYTVVRASPVEGTTSYQFTGSGFLFQAFFGVAGTTEERHYVDLPVNEYPEIYALRDEAAFLHALVQKGKPNR
jgi:hypothetical protein